MNANPSPLYRFLWLLALSCVLYIAILTIDLVMHPFAPEFFYDSVIFRLLLGLVITPLTLGIGFLIIRRKPGNVVGPLLMVWAAMLATSALRSDIEISTMAVFSNITSVGWGAIIFLGLYFPTGRVVPERWHGLISWLLVLSFGATFLILPASDSLSVLRQWHPNPVYVPMLAPFREILNVIIGVPLLLMPLMVYFVYLRFKRANLEERQQVKWFILAFVIFVLLAPVTIVLQNASGVLADTADLLVMAWIYLFPAVCFGNAILRHKLYDIDIIIRRTLIYAILTTILAVIYFGGVILAQQLFKVVTGQTSDLAIVVSTLLIAALFAPLRRRIQNVIDSRLYRRKYDAEKTLAQFQQNLRDEVDMQTLKTNLVSVVSDTMQPNKIALWVKEK